MKLLAFEMLKVSNYLFTNGSLFKIVEHFYCRNIGKYSSKSYSSMSWTSSPWKWYVLLSVIIQIHNYTFILKTFWKHLTDISDYKGRSLSSIKARSQIKDKSLISCMCQYSTLLEQLSLLSLVFLYLQYIFYFVNFALIMRDLLELETRSKHFLPTSSATSCNKKRLFYYT